MEIIPEGLLILDENNNYEFANQGLFKILKIDNSKPNEFLKDILSLYES